MKREALLNTKLGSLQRALGIPKYSAIGILEALWHLTARQARRGDIGRLSDEEIAFDLGWAGDPGELVAALVASRWVDGNEEFRLVVHDWSEHCDDATHLALARRVEFFADGAQPKLTRLGKDEKAAIIAAYDAKKAELSKAKSGKSGVRTRCAQKRTACVQDAHEKRTTMPCHAMPNLTKPNHAMPETRGGVATLTAEQVFNQIVEPAVYHFHGAPPGRLTRDEYIRALEGWSAHGLVPTEDQVRLAVSQAGEWWASDPERIGRCQSAGPVVKTLSAILNPITPNGKMPSANGRNRRNGPEMSMAEEYEFLMAGVREQQGATL